MHEQDYIDGAEYREALHSGLGLSPGHKYRVIKDPFLFDLVQQELIDKYGINTVRKGGLKAYTTIDPELQERAQEAVDSCSVCYPEGGPAAGPRLGRSEDGRNRRPRLDRRLRKRKRIQLRLAGPPPARLLVQDLRADDGDQAGDRPRQHLLRRHLADDARNSGRRHLDGQQRRARRRHDVARRSDLGLGQRDLRPARPRRRPRKRHPDCPRNGHRSAARIGAGGGDRRSPASASRRSNRPTATRPLPAAASTTTRPRSAGSNSPTARSRKPTPTPANGC